MNIIQVGCSVAGRGGYGGDYYGGTHGILVLEQHYTCSFTCNHQNPRQIFHELNRQKIALNIRDKGSCCYEIDKESYLEAMF